MKKSLYLVMLVSLGITSCIKSPEDKANILIEDYIKSCLFKPDTYENVSIRVDSAFTPYCDPNFHKILLKLKEISENMDECDRKIEWKKRDASNAKSSMTIYSDGYSAHSRNQYQQYKEEYEEHNRKLQEQIEKKKALMAKKERLHKKIKTEISKTPQFIGFQAVHRYRADNNAGQTMLADAYFVFDKDFIRVLLVYDMNNEDFKAIDEKIKELKEEQE